MLLQVSGSQLPLRVRVCVCGKEKEYVHMRIQGGDRHGNERHELMAICPLSCPWGLEDRGSSQAELDACHSRCDGDGDGDGDEVGGGVGGGRRRGRTVLRPAGSQMQMEVGSSLQTSHWQSLCPLRFWLVKYIVEAMYNGVNIKLLMTKEAKFMRCFEKAGGFIKKCSYNCIYKYWFLLL